MKNIDKHIKKIAKGNNTENVALRHAICWYLYNKENVSISTISKITKINRSSVYYAISKFTERLSVNDKIAVKVLSKL